MTSILNWQARLTVLRETPVIVPSPLNGERVRVRGGRRLACSISSNAWATAPASPVEHFPDALLALACPALAAQANRAASHQVPGCNAPRHKRNRDSAARPCVVAGTCKRKSAGRGEWPTVSSRPTWILCGGHGRASWDSSRAGLAKCSGQFKRCWFFPPLTLALSPLRGEGMRYDSLSKLRIATSSRNAHTLPV